MTVNDDAVLDGPAGRLSAMKRSGRPERAETAPAPALFSDDDNVLLRPVVRDGLHGPLVGHIITAKEIWELLTRGRDLAADPLLTVLAVQRWLTDPRDQSLAPDARRGAARALAQNLAQRRFAAGRSF